MRRILSCCAAPYDLQNQNIDQLKSNNAAITENNQLLRERCERLEEESGRLKAENASLRAEQAHSNTTKIDYAPTGIPLEIVKLYRQVDSHVLYEEQVASVLRHPKLEIEVAFSELSDHEIVSWGSIGNRGVGYYLTALGKKLVLHIQP